MCIAYVKKQGAVVHKTGRRIVIVQKDGTQIELRIIDLDGLVLFGNIQLTTQAVEGQNLTKSDRMCIMKKHYNSGERNGYGY